MRTATPDPAVGVAGSQRPTVSRFERQQQYRFLRIAAGFLVAILIALALMVTGGTTGPLIALILVGGPVLVLAIAWWLWVRPVRGIYVLFGAACAVDVNYSDTTAGGYYVAHYLPFWQDFTAWTHVHIQVSVAELFMALVLIVWILKSVAERRTRWEKGSLALPIGLYMLMIAVGELHGIGTGGNITTSLWELRAQIYMLIAYVLACNLIRTRKQIEILTWILVVGVGFRAVEGSIRYFMFYRGHVLQVVDVFPHEQAFFINGFITLTAILFVYGGSQTLRRVCVFFLPFVLFIDFAINRRASVAALGVAAILFLLITLVAYPPRRRLTATILITLAIAFPPYYLAFHNKAGTIAEPARAVGSMITPDPRDAASNQYRISENYDIMATMKSSTLNSIIGYGFGKPMFTPQILPSIGEFYVWWNIMPHNSILWVWMRIGTIGFILLWFMFGIAIVQSMQLLRRLQDARLQGLILFIALMLVQEIIFGYLDLQWTNYRNLVTVGLLFALISRITVIAQRENVLLPETDDSATGLKRPAGVTDFGGLTVVDGRLQEKSA